MSTSETPKASRIPPPAMVNGVPYKPGSWDDNEDELLAHYQKEFGNRWSQVAKYIPGRTGQQCAQRWRHRVNPNIKKEKWTLEEDRLLMRLVHRHGSAWAEIARGLEGRTDQQCMGRWRRHLDPKVRRDVWTPQEDARLTQMVGQLGAQWSRICRHVKSRTAQQCRARWFQLEMAAKMNGSQCWPTLPVSPALVQPQQQQQQRAQSTAKAASASEHDSAASDGSQEDSGERYVPPTLRPRGPRIAKARVRAGGGAGESPTESPIEWTPAEPASLRQGVQLTAAGRALLLRRSGRATPAAAPAAAREDSAGPQDFAGRVDSSSSGPEQAAPRVMLTTRGTWPPGGVDPPAGIRAHPLLWKPPSEKAQQAQQQDSPADIRHGTARAPAPLTGFSTPQKAAMTSQDSRSLASMQSTRTRVTTRDRRSSMLTTSTVNAPSAAADTPGGSSLSAMTDASPARPEERIDSTAQGAMPAKAPARAAGGLAADAHASPTRDRHLGRAPDAHQQAAELPTAVSPASSPTKPARSPISPASRAKAKMMSLDNINRRASRMSSLLSPSRVPQPAQRPVPTPPSDDKALVTTSQEHRTKETLFATPEHRAPGGDNNRRSGRKRASPSVAPAEAGPASGPDGRCQTERESGASPPGSVWRSSTPGTALGTLLRSPELPGDPLQEPGSDFRTAVQNLVTPDWAAGKARPRCDGCTCACTCGKSAAAAAAAAAVAAQDEQQLRLSRQLATSRQAKPQVARRLLVDAHADDVLVVDERAAAETPSKKRRAEPKAASTVPVNGRTASRSGSELGKKANKALPAPRHPSAYALPAAVPKGRVFAINGFHAAHTELVRPSVLVAPGPSMRDSPELGPAAALGSTYVRMRLDALLSSI